MCWTSELKHVDRPTGENKRKSEKRERDVGDVEKRGKSEPFLSHLLIRSEPSSILHGICGCQEEECVCVCIGGERE